jgi:peptidyl-prolyl cis-trans isomerase A (cyclophilin A)
MKCLLLVAAAGLLGQGALFAQGTMLAQDSQTRVVVRFETEAGNFTVVLRGDLAPITTRNFLRYVDAGLYENGFFHRTVKTKGEGKDDNQPQSTIKIDVVQGGIDPARAQSFGPIPLERTNKTGLRHVDGSISMARSTPDSATSDFFFCIGDQPSLDYGGQRNPDGQGFAAFGQVLEGREVLRKIQLSPAEGQRLDPPVHIRRVVRIE